MTVPGLTEKDHAIYRIYRRHEVLQDVNGQLLRLGNGAIIVCCSDGDQMSDRVDLYERLMRPQREEPRPHLLASHGGALRISTSSPLITPELPRDTVLLADIREARTLKSMGTLILEAHAPCGVATLHNLNLSEVIRLLKEGAQRIRKEMPDLDVACFIHLDLGDGRKRTYFVSGSNFKKIHSP